MTTLRASGALVENGHGTAADEGFFLARVASPV
jgi:hypothetical protein